MKFLYIIVIALSYSCDPEEIEQKLKGEDKVGADFALVITDQTYFGKRHNPPVCIEGVLQEEYRDQYEGYYGAVCSRKLTLKANGDLSLFQSDMIRQSAYQIKGNVIYTQLDVAWGEHGLKPSFEILDDETMVSVNDDSWTWHLDN
jgi:hypothetical protein